LANSGAAKKIFLTGVDGYIAGDIRRTEIDKTIDNYQSLKKKVELISITPTRYKIKTTSVYAFRLKLIIFKKNNLLLTSQ
jgi:4-hydroxy 2-oxovalerate aldolase